MKSVNHVKISAVLTLLGLTGCSMGTFETISLSEKQGTLKSTSILKNASTRLEVGERNNNPAEEELPVTSPPAEQIEIPVSTICSNRQTQNNDGLNLATATSIKVDIVLADSEIKTPVCTTTDLEALRRSVLTRDAKGRRNLEVKNCILKDGQAYEISVAATSTALARAGTKSIIGGRETYRFIKSPVAVSPTRTAASEEGERSILSLLVNKNSSSVPSEECDRRASPLMIQTVKTERLSFSSVYRKPVYFDLLGANATNFDLAVHQKVPLSWIEQPGFMFLARPSRSAAGSMQISGIDNLFGDNTVGPDGQTSENGYAALKKFDSNRDGYITRLDPVFKELALWGDNNLDGVATPNELKQLADLKIQVIDLSYDENFKETDAETGNEVVYKSVVKTADQNILLMFDLWFNLSHIVN